MLKVLLCPLALLSVFRKFDSLSFLTSVLESEAAAAHAAHAGEVYKLYC